MKRIPATATALLLAATFLKAHEPSAVDIEATKRTIRIADLEMAKAVSDRNLEKFNALREGSGPRFLGLPPRNDKGRAVIPSPSPFLSSRAKRGICVPLDQVLPLRAGSARDPLHS